MAPTKQFYAISCINVGVGPGGTTSMLARIAIVDYRGNTIVDTYVAPTMKVTEYRTATTGIEPAHLSSRNAVAFNTVQQHVANIIKGHVLVGHSIWNDLSVLGIPHPAVDTRDVALYQPFRNALRSPNHIVGLQTLSWQLMCRRCQESEQNPLENARAALDLYRSDAVNWEDAIRHGSWPCALPPSTFSRCYI
ncbi:ribonuclease H-like domain-containing protein [Lentinula detonsa]|uniref:RNA exonuclease 4 n=2 Tax=Lentinula TaxID=5352 RepID=A0A9W8PB24_9AGAR|nr:ribonuclease H-like domain-containing protein [Lentinula detonsa]